MLNRLRPMALGHVAACATFSPSWCAGAPAEYREIRFYVERKLRAQLWRFGRSHALSLYSGRASTNAIRHAEPTQVDR